MSNRGDPFEWSGGHPALDLVNTLDERPFDAPIENLATYRDLVRFAELAGLMERSLARALLDRTGPACARVGRRARKLREQLYNVLAAARAAEPIPQMDLKAIGAAIRAAHAARILVATPSTTLARSSVGSRFRGRCSAACLRAGHRAFALGDGSRPNSQVRRARLRSLLHRHEQRPAPAVVQHEELRQSGEAETLALERRMIALAPIMSHAHQIRRRAR